LSEATQTLTFAKIDLAEAEANARRFSMIEYTTVKKIEELNRRIQVEKHFADVLPEVRQLCLFAYARCLKVARLREGRKTAYAYSLLRSACYGGVMPREGGYGGQEVPYSLAYAQCELFSAAYAILQADPQSMTTPRMDSLRLALSEQLRKERSIKQESV
jgi:hypothetical protein